MEFSIIPDKEALSQCAWCHNPISDEMEVLGFGAKLRPDVDLSEYASHCIEIGLVSKGKPVCMMVTGEGSQAKEDGRDGMFLVCSEACGEALKNTLEKEIVLGKFFEAVRGVQA